MTIELSTAKIEIGDTADNVVLKAKATLVKIEGLVEKDKHLIDFLKRLDDDDHHADKPLDRIMNIAVKKVLGFQSDANLLFGRPQELTCETKGLALLEYAMEGQVYDGDYLKTDLVLQATNSGVTKKQVEQHATSTFKNLHRILSKVPRFPKEILDELQNEINTTKDEINRIWGGEDDDIAILVSQHAKLIEEQKAKVVKNLRSLRDLRPQELDNVIKNISFLNEKSLGSLKEGASFAFTLIQTI